MKRLPTPNVQALDLFDACVDEMGVAGKAVFNASRSSMQKAADNFSVHSRTHEWCNLPRARHGHREDVVAGELSKGDLVDLYDQGVIKSIGRPREIYDRILAGARGSCPYCAGIGSSRTLDHYLPKSKFPAFSVHPLNLVPACRDCNTDAGAGFPMLPNEQLIHPYLDLDFFFLERWVHAEVVRCEPIVIRFFAKPPIHWSRTDKARAKQHFGGCNLRDRFSSQVAGELSPLILQRKSTLSVFSSAQFKDHLRVAAEDGNLLLNGWKRTMYLALCESVWFCTADFNGNWLQE